MIPFDPLLLYYIYAALVAFPVAKAYQRMGLSPIFTILLAVPMAGIACCAGVMAFKRWPAQMKETV